jgi:ribonuclease E
MEAETAETDETAETPEPTFTEVGGEPRRDSERDGEREGGRDGGRRRRRRGRGRGRGGEPREGAQSFTHETVAEHAIAHEDHDAGSPEEEGFVQPPPHQGGAVAGPEGTERDLHRRRRRGRRGGRRNRREHNGEAPFQSEAPFQPNTVEVEPDLQHAVADLDRPPANEPAPAYSPPHEQPAPPPPVEAAAPSAGEPEPPRRRSTVREPAPVAIEGAPPSSTLPPPTPVISSTASDEARTPKRGWWGKRLLGDKD